MRSNLESLKGRYADLLQQPPSGSTPQSRLYASGPGKDISIPVVTDSVGKAVDGLELDYGEMLEKVGSVDPKFREFSLEEVIYHLAKELFMVGIQQKKTPDEPGRSIERFTSFIEHQGANGKIPKDLQKSILGE